MKKPVSFPATIAIVAVGLALLIYFFYRALSPTDLTEQASRRRQSIQQGIQGGKVGPVKNGKSL